jgi:O-antigen ligase
MRVKKGHIRMPSDKLRQIALIAALAVPFGLLHAFVLAEICIAITDILFLAQAFQSRNFSWCRQPWFIVAMLWWGWTLICSLPLPSLGLHGFGFIGSTIQAFVSLRLIILIAALQSWVLTTPRARYILWLLIALSVLWIGIESWQQLLTGHNIFGNPRFGDGALTGPFHKPRAGDLYGHLLFIALLPPMLACLAKGQRFWQLAGFGLAALGVATSVLIGQRMGVIFTGLGLVLAALFIRKLRRPALIIAAIAVLTLLATPILSPPTYKKLVGETSQQVAHYAQSPYGQIETRAAVMGLSSPITGWGYDGYRHYCSQDKFSGGIPALGLAPTSLALYACIQHPHNFYLQALADAGFPGLALFTLMSLSWLVAMFRGLLADKNAIRIGLFIAVFTFLWPLASTDEFPTLYLPGWLFLILGLGLAYTYLPKTAPLEPANV